MYYRTVPGDLSIDDIEQLVRFEEAGASQLVECKIAKVREDASARMTNMMKFVELKPGQLPPDIILRVASDELDRPADWSSVMLVDGTATLVHVYRDAD